MLISIVVIIYHPEECLYDSGPSGPSVYMWGLIIQYNTIQYMYYEIKLVDKLIFYQSYRMF